MKLYVAMLAAIAAQGAARPEIADVKTVYVLPMGNGLDQFLAIRLTAGNVLQVVTDPLKADAILSDQIGPALDGKIEDLYAPKTPPPDTTKDSQKDSEKDPTNAAPKRIAPASRARGTIFLVDRKTRNVLWSLYVLPKNSSPNEMNRVAERIAGKLSKDLKGK